VTVVDQHGNLLSTQNDKQDSRFDAKQLEYIQELEENYIRRIETILTPITGAANVRAQVTADVDFSRVERAEEIYRPNNTESEAAAIRSQQTLEATSTGSKLDGGIPGALSNRPPEPASAPIEAGGENKEGADKKPVIPTDQEERIDDELRSR
jgi:flagellar M-ring protein FliF